jgi:hypothetical protein
MHYCSHPEPVDFSGTKLAKTHEDAERDNELHWEHRQDDSGLYVGVREPNAFCLPRSGMRF